MERLDWAIRIAQEAGELTLRHFNQIGLAIEKKKDGSPVTVADRGAEELLRRRILEQFPDDSILGEEFPPHEGTSSWRWILDPIDGTKSFIHGVPLYANLIGIEQAGKPQIGLIWIPALGQGVWAEKGKGAWQTSPQLTQPIPARVSTVSTIEESLLLASELAIYHQTGRDEIFEILEKRAELTRLWGDAYGYYLVATGRAEIMLDPELSDWDAGPLLTILEEAGGHFTDWNGNAVITGEEGVATNAALFQEIIALTKQFPKNYSE